MKKIYLSIFLMLLAFSAKASETQAKFKNPNFNKPIELLGHSYLVYQITPNMIKELRSNYVLSKCELLAEDDKAILLKCRDVDGSNFVYYELYYQRYRRDGACYVWSCIFSTPIYEDDLWYPTVLSVPKGECRDEPVIDLNAEDIQKMDCRKELLSRSWEKYIPGAQEYFDQIPELKE